MSVGGNEEYGSRGVRATSSLSNSHTPIPKHVLIFEPLCGGHRAEFISHVLEEIRHSKETDRNYTFILGQGIALQGKIPSNVVIRPLTDAQEKGVKNASGAWGGFTFWRVLQAYLLELKPDHLLIMDLTFLELSLCFRRPSCSFSGILFVQYPELLAATSLGKKRKIKFWIKDLKTRLFLRNPKIRQIYLLNGEWACTYLNQRFGVACYQAIPDPVPSIVSEPDFQIREAYGIEEERCIFLFFGSMSARKGVDLLVDALQKLSVEAAQHAAFVFCGRPEPDYAVRYRQMISSLRKMRPDLCVILEDQFVSSERMRALFEQSQWILMPYTRPEYSSGVLVHAAAAETPVIGPKEGLIGRQIRAYELGESVDIYSDELRKSIEDATLLRPPQDGSRRPAFVQASHPTLFSQILLKGKI